MRIATLDFETDPFHTGATIAPFCVGVYHDDGTYWDYWGDDCPAALVSYLNTVEEPTVFYAHNGGNFDFYFLLPWIEGDISLINSRIVKCFIGNAELRDSYAIFPDPLSTYKKDDLTDDDYKTKFCRENREHWRSFILAYLRRDCIYLHEAVTFFHNRFGDHLTIGSCAMKQFKKIHKVETATPAFHEKFTPFYFGGRNQCFESGVIHGRFSLYDINSQYMSVMRNMYHPTECQYHVSSRITNKTYFAEIEATSYGCLPFRTRTGLDFTPRTETYFATIHEIRAGEELGNLKISRVLRAYDFNSFSRFAEFVDLTTERKIEAQQNGDALGRYFWKRLGNSCYGKLAQNPDNYMDYIITHGERPDGYTLGKSNGEYYIWEKPAEHKTYYNISTGASITGGARSILLRGLSAVRRPIYCDTDSILCEANVSLPISDTNIGEWKYEGTFDMVAIAGKKLYACFARGHSDIHENVMHEGVAFHCSKKAHKGAKLSGADILAIAQGDTVEYASAAPKFKLSGEVSYIRRNIRRTVLIA